MFKYYLYVIMAGICWGFTGTLQRLSPEGASSLTIGSIRMTAAGAMLLIYTIVKDGFSIFRQRWDLGGLLIAASGQVMYQLSFFSAVRLTGVALGTMIAVGMSPMIAGLFGRFLFKEPLTKTWSASTIIAVVGCAMLVFGNDTGEIRVNYPGCLLAFCAAFSYTFMGLGLRKMGRHGATEITTLVFSLAGLLVLPLLIIGDTSWMMSLRGMTIVLVLTVVATILPMTLFAIGVSRITFSRAYTLSLTEPLTASLLAVFLLNERITLISVLGAALLFISIFILARTPK